MDVPGLFGLPLDRFVAERTALVRALRAQERRHEAELAAAVRKPSIAAWAVNQLVRTQGAGVEALFAAGDQLRQAQADLVGGSGDARRLRAAAEGERAAAARLVDVARGLLTSDGHELGAAVLDRVADTLHAAALEPQARQAVQGGCLVRELRHIGLGEPEPAPPAAADPVAGSPEAPRRGRTRRPGPSAPGAKRRRAAEKQAPGEPEERTPRAEGGRERGERERTAVERAEPVRVERERVEREREREREETERREIERAAELEAARRAAAEAGRRAERAARALAGAQSRRERAAQALAEADRALAAALAEAASAEDAHRLAQVELGPG